MFEILFETRSKQSKSGLETVPSRDRDVETETSTLLRRVTDGESETRTVMRWQLIDEENHEERIERRRKWCRYI